MLSTGNRILLTPTDKATARGHEVALEPDQIFAGPPGRGYLSAGRGVDLIQLAVG